MTALFWLALSAMAGPERSSPPEADLAALGLLRPTESPSGALRYPLDRGAVGQGLVVLHRLGDEASANLAFDGLARTAATRWPEWQLPSPSPFARTLGDGQGILLVRSGNDVWMIRDPAGRAAELAAQLGSLLAR